jgi:FAD/FMN-containing dehydrogenase
MRGRLGEQVTSFELLQRSCLDFVFDTLEGHDDPLSEIHPWYVLTEVTGQGAPGSLKEPLEEALAEAIEQELVPDAVIAASGDQSKKLWAIREELAEAQKLTGTGIKHDVSVPLSRIAEFIDRADAALEQAYPGIRPCGFGHVGDGNIHYNVSVPKGGDDQEFLARWEEINEIVHDIVHEMGGSISAEHGLGRLKREEITRYKSQTEMELMRKIKALIDPKGIMNPGKVL